MENTEPYRGARPRIRDFDQPVDRELGATLGNVEDEDTSPVAVLEETVGRMQRDLVRKSLSENTKGSEITTCD